MAEASLRYVLKSSDGRVTRERTEYILGRNTRSEWRSHTASCDGDPHQDEWRVEYGPLRADIQNRDLHYRFHLDLEARVYTKMRLDDYGFPTFIKPNQTPRRTSGRNLNIKTETIDTGERRELFGHLARRVTTRVTHACPGDFRPSESYIDGWYIDSAAWCIHHPPGRRAVLLASSNGKFDTPEFTDIGEPEIGFPLMITRTHRSNFRDGNGEIQVHASEDREEVIGFSEEPLDFSLFVPPRGFHCVLQLSGETCLGLPQRMRLEWERLKDSFRGQRGPLPARSFKAGRGPAPRAT